jgi:hypothetical protein
MGDNGAPVPVIVVGWDSTHCLINSYSLIIGLPLICSLYSGLLISIVAVSEACLINCMNFRAAFEIG